MMHSSESSPSPRAQRRPVRAAAQRLMAMLGVSTLAIGSTVLPTVAQVETAPSSQPNLFDYSQNGNNGESGDLFDLLDNGNAPAGDAEAVPTAPSVQPGGSGSTGSSLDGDIPSVETQIERSQSAPGSGAGGADRYRLGAGDAINVDVFGVPEFSGEQQVLSDGTINMPLLGTVQVKGLTLQEAADFLALEYANYLNTPIVNVRILEARASRIAVAGEVRRPGPYVLGAREGNENNITTATVPTVTSLIQEAGGITAQANVREIQVRRPLPNGETQVFDVDLWKMVQEGDLSQDLELLDGDSIVVGKADDTNNEEAIQLASANFSPNEILVNVVGEVQEPGQVAMPPNTPLNQAILYAGGFTSRARRGEVELVRLNPDGSVEQREVDIDFESGVNDDSNPTLRNTDVVIVGRSGLAQISDVLELAATPFTPFGQLFNILGDIDDLGND